MHIANIEAANLQKERVAALLGYYPDIFIRDRVNPRTTLISLADLQAKSRT
jgi:hypothetical protein